MHLRHFGMITKNPHHHFLMYLPRSLLGASTETDTMTETLQNFRIITKIFISFGMYFARPTAQIQVQMQIQIQIQWLRLKNHYWNVLRSQTSACSDHRSSCCSAIRFRISHTVHHFILFMKLSKVKVHLILYTISYFA